MSVFSAARTLGRENGWRQSKLEMHKTLFIGTGIHLSIYGKPLFADTFEAWDYGPVLPALHGVTRGFDREPVTDIFSAPFFDSGTTEALAIEEAWALAKDMTPGQLITYTHRRGGAWEEVYDPANRNAIISNESILREWDQSARASDEAVTWALAMADQLEARPSRYLDPADERAFRERLRHHDLH